MPRFFDLGKYSLWESSPFIIAEAGVNHGGDLDQALQMVEAASEAGIDAIKFQTYKASRIATRTSEAYWDTSLEPAQNQFELFSRFVSGPGQHRARGAGQESQADEDARQRSGYPFEHVRWCCCRWKPPLSRPYRCSRQGIPDRFGRAQAHVVLGVLGS